MTEALPDQDEPYIIGDHISIVEMITARGQGLALLSPELGPAHLSLLLQAASQIVHQHVHTPSLDEGRDSDAA